MASTLEFNWTVGDHDDVGSDIAIEIQGAPIANVLGAESFPCLDEEENDFEALHREAVAVAYRMAAANDLLSAAQNIYGEEIVFEGSRCFAIPIEAYDDLQAAIAKATPPTD